MAFLRYRFDLTGIHLRFFRPGVTFSNFLVPETMRAAKFCTPCSLRILLVEVFDHADEQ